MLHTHTNRLRWPRLRPLAQSTLKLISNWPLLLIVALVGAAAWLSGPGVKLFRPAHAASTYYVRTDGSDTLCNGSVDIGPDDETMPAPNCAFATIGKAIQVAVNGDTIVVGIGVFTENLTLNEALNLRGANANISGCGSVEAETVIVPSNAAVRTLELQTGSAGATINGFNFSGGSRSIESTSGPLDNLSIINNRFVGFTGNAIVLNDPGTDITVRSNSVDGASKTGNGGLVELDTDTFDGFVFSANCVFNGATVGTGTGFFVNGNRNIKPSINRPPSFDHNSISGNLIGVNSGNRSFQSVSFSANLIFDNVLDGHLGGPKDSMFINNVFDNNGRTGIALTDLSVAPDSGARNNTVKQNLITRNGFTNNGEGVLFSPTQEPGTISTNKVNFNRIIGNRVGATYNGTETINVENNWWGCNYGPGAGGAGCSGTTNGLNGTGAANLDANPWLTLTLTAMPASLASGETSTLRAKLTINSDNVDTTVAFPGCYVPDETPVAFASGGLGTVAPPSAGTTNGVATSNYFAQVGGTDTVSATVDGQTVSTTIMIKCPTITGVVTGGTGESSVCGGQPVTVRVTISNTAEVPALPYTVTLNNNGGTLIGDGPDFDFTVNPTTTTTYMLASGQDANGCPITGSGSATVTVKPTPTCNLTGADAVTPGSTNTYNANANPPAGTTYSWEISGNGTISGLTTNPSVNVLAGAPGSYTLTVTVTNGSSGCSSICTKTVAVSGSPSISKSFGSAQIQLNGTTSLSFTIINPNPDVPLTGVAFNDALPGGLVVANPPNVVGACGGTVTATAGSSTISLMGGTVASNGSCTITVNVTGTSAGTKNNSVTINSSNGGQGNTATATLNVIAPPTIAKSFNPSTINIGGVSQLTLSFSNVANNVALSNLAVSDAFPMGMTVAATPGLVNTCGGTVTGATAGSGSISLSGGGLAAGPSNCQVQVNVTSSTPGAANNTTGNVTATGNGLNVTGSTASATLTANAVTSTPTVSIADPFGCTGSGDVLTITVVVTNTASVAQPITFTATLPSGLVGLPGTGTSTVGSAPTVNAASVSFGPATFAAGQSATVIYQVQVGDAASGATLCINTTSTFSGAAGPPVQACTTLNCPAVGPGSVFPATGEVSDQKAGSVLVYNLYSSSIAAPNAQNTRISITNTNPNLPIAVHLFFVDGATCSIADSLVCLTANQTASFLASDIDPGTTGYIVAVASDLVTGCPINFNFLIGDEYVKLSSGHAANLAAEGFAAIAGGLPACNGLSVTALLSFDGASYNRAPRVLAASNIPSRADNNDTLIVLNRLGGSLAAGASTLGSLFGILYDDAENPLSFTFTAGVCQFRSSLSSNFPRVAPRFEQFIPAGRSGWAKFYSQSDIALLGAQLNFNANAGTAANAFNQGHNLHKLTLTTAATLTIPIFPPNC